MPDSTSTPPSPAVTVQWCLISHTNIGKTSLARTLLGQDVGDIRDAAHVTDSADSYLLLETDAGHRLQLWDTPGFGDSVRLQQRLAQQGNPLGWFLSHIWDRWRDKPFWMSQRAMRAARDHADIVLYLVNAAENPEDAGYLEAEMGIVHWLAKPVIVLLNQVGAHQTPQQARQDLLRWQQAMQTHAAVRQVLVLDAFTRSWVHEQVLFRAVGEVIDKSKQAAWQAIMQAWEQRNLERLHASLEILAEQLWLAATQQMQLTTPTASGWQQLKRLAGLPDGARQQAEEQAMQQIMQTLHRHGQSSTARLLHLHGLDGQSGAQIQQQLREHFQIAQPLDVAKASLWGAIASGAATGAGADLATGGLSLGAGAVLGAVAGALGFAGLSWGLNQARTPQGHQVQLSPEFLDQVLKSCLLQYLAIAHFGRGRGSFSNSEAPQHWQAAIDSSLAAQQAQWHSLWTDIQQQHTLPAEIADVHGTELASSAAESGKSLIPSLPQRLALQLQDTMQQVLHTLYPDAQVPSLAASSSPEPQEPQP